jgi:hypothetical protein
MKILLPLFLLVSSFSFSQAAFVSNDLVVSNLSKDTVYIKNDPTGRNIYWSWQQDPYYNGKKVTVILVENLITYHQRYEQLAESNIASTEKRRRKPKK